MISCSTLEPVANTSRNVEYIQDFYRTLYRAWGCQHWWPAQSRFEVVVGAFLTQNTAWTNVERAMQQLRAARLLNVDGIRKVPRRRLETLIRSAGYFRQKAQRLKAFVAFLDERYHGSLKRMFSQPTAQLRHELLNLNGVGPETADSILLYAGNHPVFVVDTYTRRILARHQMLAESANYEEIRTLFELALAPLSADPELVPDSPTPVPGTTHAPSRMSLSQRSPMAQVFNEMHGLLVGVGKNYCRKSKALCEQCPLRLYLAAASAHPIGVAIIA